MQAKSYPSPETINRVWHVDQRTGTLRWRDGVWVGKQAGWRNSGGYICVMYQSRVYYVHRLLWIAYHHQRIRKGYVIDHRDGDKTNNRKRNLRLTTIRGNGRNRKDSVDYHNIYHQPLAAHRPYAVRFLTGKGKNKRTTYTSARTLREAVRIRNAYMAQIDAKDNNKAKRTGV